ncbi:hypothetical protein BDA99DRAFT_557038 [Phascolomyces articulosus]|uniref:Uncharacterized protein n=1 Tax=Phascolomyces articulosus TaxID=60185 RepID=A0AAD5PGW2_9FUNG|nr:hypothetical protein BDA99DRAFT_557038 [Phascolomyces articulosus]
MNLNLSKSRYERFLSRRRGDRPVHAIDPLVFLSEEEYLKKRNTTSLDSRLDILQKTRKRKESLQDGENVLGLSDEHINKLARIQRGPRYGLPPTSTEKFVIKPYVDQNDSNDSIQQQTPPKRQVMNNRTMTDNNSYHQNSPSNRSIQSHASSVAESVRSNRSKTSRSILSITSGRAPLSIRSLNSNHSKRSKQMDEKSDGVKEIEKENVGAQEKSTTPPGKETVMERFLVQSKVDHHTSDNQSIKAVIARVDPEKRDVDKNSQTSSFKESTHDNDKSSVSDPSTGALEKPGVNKSTSGSPNDNLPDNNQPITKVVSTGDLEEPEEDQTVQGSPKDDIRDDVTDFEIEYDYGDEGGVFVGEEVQQDRGLTPSALPPSSLPLQDQYQESVSSLTHDHESRNTTPKDAEPTAKPGRLPASRQQIGRSGSVNHLEYLVSKLFADYTTQTPTDQELKIIRETIYNAIPIRPSNRKSKPLVETLKELGVVAMNCAGTIVVDDEYHRVVLDTLAQVVKQQFDYQAALCQKQEELRIKLGYIKVLQDRAQNRLLDAQIKRRKMAFESGELRKKCEELHTQNEINKDVISLFNKLKERASKSRTFL